MPRRHCGQARNYRRFAKPPELEDTAFVSADASRIREALCLHTERVVARDNTVSYGNRILQIPATACGQVDSPAPPA